MEPEAILFDLDNTLVDRKLAFERYVQEFIDQFIHVYSEFDHMATVTYMIKADCNGYRNKREYYQELMDTLEWKYEITLDELLEFWFSRFNTCTVLMPGALDLLESI